MLKRRANKGKRRSGKTGSSSILSARRHWQLGEFERATKAYANAVRQDKWNVELILEAAQAFASRRQPEKCDAMLQRALSLASRNADVQFVAGQSYRVLGFFEKAEVCFQRAIQVADSAPRARLELANLCERSQRLEEGLLQIDQVLEEWPQSASALILQSRLLKRIGEGERAEGVLRDLLAAPKCKPAIQAEAWGDLAQILDSQGNYPEAWSTIQRCKEIQLQHDEAEVRAAAHVESRFQQLVQELDTSTLEQWSVFGESHPPVALMTGFPRCGTTLLEQILDAHPRIVSSEEQDFLSAFVFPALGPRDHTYPVARLLGELSAESIRQAQTSYFEFMQSSMRVKLEDRLLIDKNPAMTPMVPVFRRLFPDSKLIIAIRDPRDTLVSCYLRYLPLNPVSVSFLTTARTAERVYAHWNAWLTYRELYDDWLEVRYEQVIEDYVAESRKMLDYLGQRWDDRLLAYRDRVAEKIVRSPTYEAVTRPIYKSAIGRWQNYAEFIGEEMALLKPIITALGYDP